MALIVIGINHKTAAVALRERLVLSESQMPTCLSCLRAEMGITEAVILSTCNRLEIYMDHADLDSMVAWLCRYSGVDDVNLVNHVYHFQGVPAIGHLLQVASGLDSAMLGEPQIFGQLKQAYALSEKAGFIKSNFQRIFPEVFAMTKEIRHQTDIGRCPVTVSFAVVQLIQSVFLDFSASRIVLVGAGHVVELLVKHLLDKPLAALYIANRRYEKAEQLALNTTAQAVALDQLGSLLPQVDVVISATSSPEYMIRPEMLLDRGLESLLLIDLAMPRDIDPNVASLPGVILHNIDDLQAVVADNLQSRQNAAKQAEALIDVQIQHFLGKLQLMDASSLIQEFRGQHELFRDDELQQALNVLQQGEDPRKVMIDLARNLTNKFLHTPTTKLRSAAYDGQMERLNLIKEFFESS